MKYRLYFVVSGIAIAYSTTVLAQYQYPVVPEPIVSMPFCYIKLQDGRMLNLEQICGVVLASSTPPITSTPNSNGATTGGQPTRQRNTCNTPDDIAADGSRCGGRAASEKPGGRR